MKPKRAIAWAVSFAALGLAYAGFQHTLPPPELVSDAIAALLGTAVFVTFARSGTQRFAPRWDWLAPYVRRLPPAIVRETWDLLGPMLWRAVFARSRVRGRFIALPFEAGGDDGRSASRRVAVIYGSSITPNAIPIFVDRENQLLVLHQLEHRMEPGAGDREWPM